MASKFGIGFSQHPHAETAARAATFEAKTKLNEDRIDFVIVFFSIHYNPPEFLPIINKIVGGSRLLGCSSAGIILTDSVQTRGIGVLIITSDELKFGMGAIPNIDHQRERESGAALARNSFFNLGNQRGQSLIFFYDSSLNIKAPFISGIQETFGNKFQILGIGSTDNFQFKKNYQIFNETILQKSAVSLLIGGNVQLGVNNKHGLKPLGKPRFIDKSIGNIISTIDGKKAFCLYEEFFPSHAQFIKGKRLSQIAASYPLGIVSSHNHEFLIRNAVDILDDGSIVCQGEIPAGAEIHLMINNRETSKLTAVQTAQTALIQLNGHPPKLILIFESMARLKLLGRSAFEEIKQIKNELPSQTPIFGMYGHGEIAPSWSPTLGSTTNLQNESITIMAIA